MADAEFPEFCRFHAGGGAGTYPFRIGKPGYRTESRTVVVPGPEGCPTNAPQYVTIELSRETLTPVAAAKDARMDAAFEQTV